MPEEARLWRIIDGDKLKEIKQTKLNLEERIENWLADDISIISKDLIVIGRQVVTDFGGGVDLLCLERNGDVVILELKRDRTPRDITAQTLDYASWAKDLSNDKITDIANNYLGAEAPLEEAYKKRFGIELPDSLNEHHKMLIVASEIDSTSERIIKYLSGYWGISINAATFQYFRDEDGSEFLARVFLIEPSQVEYSTKTKTASKRRTYLSYEELQEIAERNGVGELYQRLVEGFTNYFEQKGTNKSAIVFIAVIENSRNTIFSLVPGESDSSQGVRFQVYIDRLSKFLSVSKKDIIGILPSESEKYEPWKHAPPMLTGFFKSTNEIDTILTGLNEFRQK